VSKRALQNKSGGVAAKILQLIFWPLKKLLAYTLESPALLQHGTHLLSQFPPLFNWLVGFAQAHGIIMAAEIPDPNIDQIQSTSELSPEARILFESLKTAFQGRTEKN